MDYRIEKRGAFQVVCKRKRVDKSQSGTATREISDMRQEFGANGTPTPCENVVECMVPTNITREAKIDGAWAKSKVLRDIANHHEKFYLEYVRRIVGKNKEAK